tara:strand:+ start:850 stop:1290 length:441 start_codon:yes stop_codon:yes gene_type:complete
MDLKKKMFLYLISHNKKEIKTHTYIGASGNFIRRLKQHNLETPGGPRITRRAAGFWVPIMILELPAKREFSSKVLKKEWKSSSRGLESRVRKGFEIAKKYNVKIYISKKDNGKIKLLERLHTRWTNEFKIKLSDSEWKSIIEGDNI